MEIGYIYWYDQPNKKGEVFANVHLLVGYSQGSLRNYKEMAEKLRKTFPQAKDEDILFGKVTESERFASFTLLRWNACIEKRDYPDWKIINNAKPDYKW